jgi:hypothetical protein
VTITLQREETERIYGKGVGIDQILHDSILIALLADGSKDRVDSGLGNDTSWKCGETKSAHFPKVKN